MSEIKTMVIAAFPGCGKSYTVQHESEQFNGILDSDSSEFSWVKDSNGKNTSERNPNFPNNYIKHIKSQLGKVEVIFVSSHKEVREAVEKEGIDYFLVYPNIFQKKEYIKRYQNRGSDKNFIDKIASNWDLWLAECEEEQFPTKIQMPYMQVKYLNRVAIDLIKIMYDLD